MGWSPKRNPQLEFFAAKFVFKFPTFPLTAEDVNAYNLNIRSRTLSKLYGEKFTMSIKILKFLRKVMEVRTFASLERDSISFDRNKITESVSVQRDNEKQLYDNIRTEHDAALV